MARLHSPDYGVPLNARFLDEPGPGDPSRNGAYKGSLPVRQLPLGISGDHLSAERVQPAPGQIWVRGLQTVRIISVTPKRVSFLELSHGISARSVFRSHFLRTSRLQAGA